jgi:hypothetical protein
MLPSRRALIMKQRKLLFIIASDLRYRIASLGGAVNLHKITDLDYLLWMVSEVEKQENWPIDKGFRWLGYVSGLCDVATFGLDSASIMRMKGPSRYAFPSQSKIVELALTDAILEVLSGLYAASHEDEGRRGMDLICQCRLIRPASHMSFCLGYIQALMVAWGLITVQSERDRTRPIFHKAYSMAGFRTPASVERPKED